MRLSNIKVIFQRPSCKSPYSGAFRFHCRYCPCACAEQRAAVALLAVLRDLAYGTRTLVKCVDWSSISPTELVAIATTLDERSKNSRSLFYINPANVEKGGPVDSEIIGLTKSLQVGLS